MVGVQIAHAELETVVRLAVSLLVATELSPDPPVHSPDDGAGIGLRQLRLRVVQGVVGDERHEGPRHAVAGAVRDDEQHTAQPAATPEDVAADDVAWLPDHEMLGKSL